jgi:hypothetical protein
MSLKGGFKPPSSRHQAAINRLLFPLFPSCLSFSASHYGRWAYDASHESMCGRLGKSARQGRKPRAALSKTLEAGIYEGDKNESCIVQRVWAA